MPGNSINIDDIKALVSTTVNNPLRPELYNRLNDNPLFQGGVIIANEGEQMLSRYSPGDDDKPTLQIDMAGEYYRVNCPYCTDTRKRLWINHRWGKRDEYGRLNLFLAVCYNENCLAEPGRVFEFYKSVFTDFSHEVNDNVQKLSAEDMPSSAPAWPGRRVPLDELWPNHPARVYLAERHFDALQLTKDYNLSYCLEALDDYIIAQSRIIIPAYMNGEFAGWQARYVGNPPSKAIPKYYTMPHMKRNHILYNYDRAKTYPFMVLCEGPTDAWRFGPEAVALWGKSISPFQIQLATGNPERVVYVCLDGEALIEGMSVFDKLGSAVSKALVKLPSNSDPGGLPTATLRDMVLSTPVARLGE